MTLNIPHKKLVIASSNKGKFEEFRSLLLEFPLEIINQPSDINVLENGITFSENARKKAIAVSKITKCWSLADDSGLSVEALNGAPGIYSSRFAKTDPQRIAKIIKLLERESNRKARFYAALCIASEGEVLIEVEAYCEGQITFEPRGERGFGYDPIFEVLGTDLTFAEMTLNQKRKLGHRGQAFKMLKPGLSKLLGND